ncbi:MAG: TRADD-N-associated membrane domain-containing protein [Candidatus Electrothrix sp. YB6]
MKIEQIVGEIWIYLVKNIDWLFSGTGVFLIAYLGSLIASNFLKQSRQVNDTISSSVVPEDVDNLSRLLVQNFQVLNRYYSENLSQARTSTMASLSIAILGFLVILAGVLITFIGDQVVLGTVSSGAGIVSEAAALLFFKQNKLFQEQMQNSLKKLVSTQYLMTSVALARELPEEQRSKELVSINDHLRQLMDVLHQEDIVRTK